MAVLAYAQLLGRQLPPIAQSYTVRDTILYALGLGIGLAPQDPSALAFTYEKDIAVMPTMACVLAQARDWLREAWTGIDYEKIVHGEEHLLLHRPLPAAGTVVGTTTIADIVDKGPGRGALIMMEKQLADQATGELLSTSTTTIFARGNGGFGGPARPSPPEEAEPFQPDQVIDIPTSRQMALIYRLSGDVNPLHVDPEAAGRAGYERPISHGLSLLGAAAKALIDAAAGGRPERLRAISVRFAAPAYPGETLRLSLQRRGNALRFETHSLERGVLLLGRGKAEVHP